MGCAHKPNQDGFTLVEISIVMIIIGLLIGGTFGGMRLIENMQVNRTVQDLKAIESAALTFKDTYGRLPGDMPNTAARLPNCSVAPCATGGNGNRIVGTSNLANGAITDSTENFTFWSHLQAADLASLGVKNTIDMAGGEGQPGSSVGGLYRLTDWTGNLGACPVVMQRSALAITSEPSALFNSTQSSVSCTHLSSIDTKIDDGIADNGHFAAGWGCISGAQPPCNRIYLNTGVGTPVYDLKGY